ncbi:gfo/Idh/MocA family oxidoreductase [Azospirillum cavernae]|uniref:Gfo/Idh/MocA family oxidoreductase n=1 Tax=Azospirillum cavernae TaxID=2320860 RepID=A0A418VL48_9PROT|nr:Gfo/Idh/MocA family oxidoreductase [Azospirillum cavernae]RJF76870.1 gfo/Idh/MocA family oxidoreductase [Azospirillum cavernae]
MRVIVVGMGIQGRKRRAIAAGDVVATVDPDVAEADFRHIDDVEPGLYDAALVCTPDEPKLDLIGDLLRIGKHVLVEKPLSIGRGERLQALNALARERGLVCYTAYNHRFEPHFVRMRDCIASGRLGRLYTLRLFYGNGTARDVRNSPWRDRGAGVLPDLASHLLDTLRFWLGDLDDGFVVRAAHRFENKAFDHVVVDRPGTPHIQLEMSLLSWRNHFTAELVGEHGAATIESLCKWGPSTFTLRERMLPSGRPPEEAVTLIQPDPTWALEYNHFLSLCHARQADGLERDIWLDRVIGRLCRDALTSASA